MSSPEPVRFERFELHPLQRRLLVDGQAAALGARAFDLLLALVQRAGDLVTKNELLDTVWAGLVVEEANLTVQISSLRKVLGGDIIATVPGRGYRFTAPLVRPPPLQASPPVPPPPAATSAVAPALVGRDEDLARVGAALALPGCVTLTGPAGVGKTSLARAAAAGHAGGAVWVDLAALTDGEQVPGALARALDIPPPEAAAEAAFLKALGARLLVLDNAEHLVDAAAALAAALLRQAPALHLLVTSQQALALPRERVLRLDPLALPLDSDMLDLHHGAIALFVERAHAADHRFKVDTASLPLLREICRQLDGLPLALEMAAARLPTLGLRGLRDALQSRFALLTKGHRTAAARHRTLHAALDWSHGLLNADEQRLFRALGVFAGGFTLELALAVLAGPRDDRWAIVDTLSSLLDRSLVSTDGQDPPRYRLLESVRAYALEKLAAAGEEPLLRRRLGEGLVALIGPTLGRTAGDRYRDLGNAEHDNAREAMAWAQQHDAALAVALAPRIAMMATFSSWRGEALQWFETSAALLDDATVDDAVRAEWWTELGRQRVIARHSGADEASLRGRELHQRLGNDLGVFMADIGIVRSGATFAEGGGLDTLAQELQQLHDRHPEWGPRTSAVLAGTLAYICRTRDDEEGALRYRIQELEMATRGGLVNAIDSAASNIVATLLNLGRPEEALPRCQELLARIGDQDNINSAYTWCYLLGALARLGRGDEARATLPRVMALSRRFGIPSGLEELAPVLLQERRPRASALLVGHLLRAYRDADAVVRADAASSMAGLEGPARQALGDAGFEALREAGEGMSDAEILAVLQRTEPEA